MDRWHAKLVTILLSFLIPWISTLLPLKISQFITRKHASQAVHILSWLMCFGGGVFFGTLMLHMAPDARHLVYIYFSQKHGITYPVADLVMALGFFFVLTMEQAVNECIKRSKRSEDGITITAVGGENRSLLNINGHIGQTGGSNFGESAPLDIPDELKETSDKLKNVHVEYENETQTSSVNNVPSKSGSMESEVKNHPLVSNDLKVADVCVDNGCSTNDSSSAKSKLPLSPQVWPTKEPILICPKCKCQINLNAQGEAKADLESFGNHSACSSEDGDVHDHHEAAVLQDSNSRLSIILMLALSLHRLFEGMGIGLQYTQSGVWSLFGAIMCHECVIGFSLGLQLVKHKWRACRSILTITLCSIVLPLGIMVGTLVVELQDTNDTVNVVNGFLQSVAAGTFIYVIFFEIIGEEFSGCKSSKAKILSLFLGFLLMVALSAIPENSAPSPDSSDLSLAANLTDLLNIN